VTVRVWLIGTADTIAATEIGSKKVLRVFLVMPKHPESQGAWQIEGIFPIWSLIQTGMLNCIKTTLRKY